MNLLQPTWPPLILAVFLAGILNGCQPTQSQSQSASRYPDRDSLMNALRAAGKMVVVIPANSPQALEYLAWAEDFSKNSRFLKVEIQADTALNDSLLTTFPIMIVGAWNNNQMLQSWMSASPVKGEKEAFQFQGKKYQQPSHAIALSWYPQPNQSGLPMSIMTGNSDEAVLAMLRQSNSRRGFGGMMGRWDYQVFEEGESILLGNYDSAWNPDPGLRWEFDLHPKPQSASGQVAVYFHGTTTEDAQPFIDHIEANRQTWETWSGIKLPEEPLAYHLYAHPEQMGLRINEMETAIRKGSAVHRLIHPAFLQHDPGLEWDLWMEQSLGAASLTILRDGLRVQFQPAFLGKGALPLAASLIRAHGKVTLATMLSESAYERESPLVRDCYAGAFVDFLLTHQGKEAVLSQYRALTWEASTPGLAEAWDAYQTNLLSAHPEAERNPLPAMYQQGMTFAHEGYQVYNGYGSRLAEGQLQRVEQLGATAVAIVPYTGTSSPQSAEPLRWSRGAGSENDASVILSFYRTQQEGMITMLKPQVWVRGGWPGDVDMPKEEDWASWFDHYHRWIRHYALLAEVHGMEVLCLGTEFRYATIKHPDRWRNLIKQIRHIYHGSITYAANWGDEVENLAFADALDWVGINCYYPLSEADAPTDEELAAAFEKHMKLFDKLSAKWGKPYVLTEIGFRSIDMPWKHPHADAGEAAVNHSHQARCYQVVLNALPGHPMCRGLYWWKWPSHEAHTLRDPQCFTVCGKEAENLLKIAYQRGIE